MVFAKETGDHLTSLVKQIDKLVGENKESKMASFVNIIGEDRDKLEAAAKKLGEPLKNVAVVVPAEFEAGPKDYGVNPEAGVTVLIYQKLKVLGNHAVAPGKLDDKKVQEIIEDAAKLLK
jgi:hypothetical protein